MSIKSMLVSLVWHFLVLKLLVKVVGHQQKPYANWGSAKLTDIRVVKIRNASTQSSAVNTAQTREYGPNP